MRLPRVTAKVQQRKLLQTTTLRGFSGGLNVTDDDMNLAFRFATKLVNCYVSDDGGIKVRDGITKFAAIGVRLIEVFYFVDSLVAVDENGDIWRILADGTVISLDNTLWNETTFASGAVFNGHLILCNGSDKPLDIDSNFVVELLQDAATNTNINVPIGRYVIAAGRYLLIAGDPLFPDRVHISAKDAAGTWYGDPPPNDGIFIDAGSSLPDATIIRGLIAFRGRVVVQFAEGQVLGILGAYDADGNHTPNFDDGIPGYGGLSHRVALAYGDNALFLDLSGVPSLERTVFSNSFKPDRLSQLIDPAIQGALAQRTFGALEDHTFGVHNKKLGQYFIFIPNGDTPDTTTETVAYVYTKNADNQEPWAEFRGWNFTCGTKSQAGLIFFGDKNGDIWLYTGDRDYVDKLVIPVNEGAGIAFDWELPWLDFGNRALIKNSKHISFDTRGASEFRVRMYVDNFLEVQGVDAPTLVGDFSGGEQGLFGEGDQPYGGGRNTSRKKLYAWPTKFEIAKLRFSGTANAGLKFIAITLHYLTGGINR